MEQEGDGQEETDDQSYVSASFSDYSDVDMCEDYYE